MVDEIEIKQTSIDFTKLEEVKAGTKEETTVAIINTGTAGQFRPEGYWAAIKDITKADIEAKKLELAIEIVAKNGATMVMAYPANNKVHPKSNLALWRKTYGAYPALNQTIMTKVDDTGFVRIVLEK